MAWGLLETLHTSQFEGAEYESDIISQPAITCSKLTIETLEKGVTYVQS